MKIAYSTQQYMNLLVRSKSDEGRMLPSLESIPEVSTAVNLHQTIMEQLTETLRIKRNKQLKPDMATLEKLDPLYHFNTRFPGRTVGLDIISPTDEKKPLSIRNRRKNNPRYKTQPITFDEIKEVEEPTETPTEPKSFGSYSFLDNLDSKINTRLTPTSPRQTHSVTVMVYPADENQGQPWSDTQYPEKLSFLDRPEHVSSTNRAANRAMEKRPSRNRRERRRNNPRFKTQPITFDEIKEVEEPTIDSPCQPGRTFLDKPPNSMDLLFNKSKQQPMVGNA